VSFIPSGIADPLAQGIPERHARGPGDEHGQSRRRRCRTSSAHLAGGREGAAPSRRIHSSGGRLAECVQRVGDRDRSRLGGHHAGAEGVGQQIPQRDRALRRNGVVQWPVADRRARSCPPAPGAGRRPGHRGAACSPRRASSHTRRRSALSSSPCDRSCRRPSASSTLRPRTRDCPLLRCAPRRGGPGRPPRLGRNRCRHDAQAARAPEPAVSTTSHQHSPVSSSSRPIASYTCCGARTAIASACHEPTAPRGRPGSRCVGRRARDG
jgi:hypothetical protein